MCANTIADLEQRHETRIGLVYALSAYLFWGAMPLYYALLRETVSAGVIVAHRVIWTVVFLALVLGLQRRWKEVKQAAGNRRVLFALLGSAVLIAVNWVVFVYAVMTGQVTQAALGYYINPLVSVLLGLVVLRERLRRTQWVSVVIAATGVALAAKAFDSLPWIAVTLATSFGLYGLVRKIVPVGPMVGLLIEVVALLPLAGTYVVWTYGEWSPGLLPHHALLLILAGVVTALPLIWFSAGARRLKLSTIGFLQYISPTAQLIVATAILGEPLERARLLSFGLIWLALALFSIDSYRSRRAQTPAPVEMVE